MRHRLTAVARLLWRYHPTLHQLAVGFGTGITLAVLTEFTVVALTTEKPTKSTIHTWQNASLAVALVLMIGYASLVVASIIEAVRHRDDPTLSTVGWHLVRYHLGMFAGIGLVAGLFIEVYLQHWTTLVRYQSHHPLFQFTLVLDGAIILGAVGIAEWLWWHRFNHMGSKER